MIAGLLTKVDFEILIGHIDGLAAQLKGLKSECGALQKDLEKISSQVNRLSARDARRGKQKKMKRR